MQTIDWAKELNVAITVSDLEGKIIYMNEKSAATFGKYGGMNLLGTNLRECHKPGSWEKISEIMRNDTTNCYTIEKDGIRKMIFQAPWYEQGKLSGLVELSLEIPFVMDHFIRS